MLPRKACGSGWWWLVSGRRRVALVLNGTDVLNGIDDGRRIARSIRRMTFCSVGPEESRRKHHKLADWLVVMRWSTQIGQS